MGHDNHAANHRYESQIAKAQTICRKPRPIRRVGWRRLLIVRQWRAPRFQPSALRASGVKELKRVQLKNRPIYIEDIGKVAGVSARAIFQASKETYSCSPMAYVFG